MDFEIGNDYYNYCLIALIFTFCFYLYLNDNVQPRFMYIVDLTFRITTCRSLLAIAFRT